MKIGEVLFSACVRNYEENPWAFCESLQKSPPPTNCTASSGASSSVSSAVSPAATYSRKWASEKSTSHVFILQFVFSFSWLETGTKYKAISKIDKFIGENKCSSNMTWKGIGETINSLRSARAAQSVLDLDRVRPRVFLRVAAPTAWRSIGRFIFRPLLKRYGVETERHGLETTFIHSEYTCCFWDGKLRSH